MNDVTTFIGWCVLSHLKEEFFSGGMQTQAGVGPFVSEAHVGGWLAFTP